MNFDICHSNMDPENDLHNISQKITEIRHIQTDLNEQLLSIDNDLNRSLEDHYAINAKLKEFLNKKRIEKAAAPMPIHAEPMIQRPLAQPLDATAQLEKLLQGSLDALGDKISDRLMGMLKELRSLPVEMRGERLHDIKQAADAELVDLSALYKYQEVQSNIEQVGVDEKEAKGIDKNLEKLRKMRQKKPE